MRLFRRQKEYPQRLPGVKMRRGGCGKLDLAMRQNREGLMRDVDSAIPERYGAKSVRAVTCLLRFETKSGEVE